MPLALRPLDSAAAHLEVILDDMERAWQETGQPQSIRPQLEQKREEIRQGKVRGVMAFDEEQPVGLAWTELPHGEYGNILLHTFQPEHRLELAESCVRAGLLDNLILELVQLRPGDEYRRAFVGLGLREKLRQKMIFRLDQRPQPPEGPADLSFEPLTIEHAEIAGTISHAAHEISKDLEGYPDFTSPAACAALQKKIFQGLFGEVVRPASLLARYQNEPAGLCLVVAIPGWGYERVAWVLDLVVRPELQRRGIGRTMLQQSLQGLVAANIPVAGLAVTLDNPSAERLYEKVGFQTVQQFYEYIGPMARGDQRQGTGDEGKEGNR